MAAPVDPWAVLRALRARPLVRATRTDDSINGGDAVDELRAIRRALDAALRRASRTRTRKEQPR